MCVLDAGWLPQEMAKFCRHSSGAGKRRKLGQNSDESLFCAGGFSLCGQDVIVKGQDTKIACRKAYACRGYPLCQKYSLQPLRHAFHCVKADHRCMIVIPFKRISVQYSAMLWFTRACIVSRSLLKMTGKMKNWPCLNSSLMSNSVTHQV